MRTDSKRCDHGLFDAILFGHASERDRQKLADHLDQCHDCRTRLESLAASEPWWRAASEFLPDELHDLDSLGCDSGPSGESQAHDVSAVLDGLAPSDDPRMLGRLGAYEVLGVVGSGGMGVVLKARDPALDRHVAIKVLSPHLASSGAARRRFGREAKAAAAVVHDNVIEIYGVAEFDGLPFLVMPYIRGTSLQQRLDQDGGLALEEILRVGSQTAAGLAAAHAQGLVHRDIKPANILLPEGVERVQITDFGLARAADDASLTRTGMIAGTPQFMSPEQARGDRVDQRSDLFSLGSVLYTLCTARRPFRADSSYGILRRITDSEPRPIREINPRIPAWLCRLVSRLHAKQPEKRPQTATEVAELLRQCLAHVQQPETQPLPETLQSANHRKTGPLLIAVAAMLIVAGAVWGVIHFATNTQANRTGQDATAAPNNGRESRPKTRPPTSNPVDNSVKNPPGSLSNDELRWNSEAAELEAIDRGTRELDTDSLLDTH